MKKINVLLFQTILFFRIFALIYNIQTKNLSEILLNNSNSFAEQFFLGNNSIGYFLNDSSQISNKNYSIAGSYEKVDVFLNLNGKLLLSNSQIIFSKINFILKDFQVFLENVNFIIKVYFIK